MTISEIQNRVRKISRAAHKDFEAAHSQEDLLRRDFILYVLEHGDANLSAMANEVLKTDSIKFTRSCA